jgi:hypothetical protein
MDKLLKTQWAERRIHEGPLGQYIDGFSDLLRERGNAPARTTCAGLLRSKALVSSRTSSDFW